MARYTDDLRAARQLREAEPAFEARQPDPAPATRPLGDEFDDDRTMARIDALIAAAGEVA